MSSVKNDKIPSSGEKKKRDLSLPPAEAHAGPIPGAWRDQPGPVRQVSRGFDREDGHGTKQRTKSLTKRQGTACGYAATRPVATRDCTFKSEENAECPV